MSASSLAVALALWGPVEWEAPPGCPSQATVRGWVAQGVPVPPEDLRVRATTRELEAHQWTVRVEVQCNGARHQRELKVPNCEAGAEAVAVVVGMLCPPPSEAHIEDAAPGERVQAPVLGPSTPAERLRRQSQRTPEPAATERPQRSLLQLGLRVAGGAVLGGLPASGALHAGAGVGGQHWWVWGGVEHFVVRRLAPAGVGDVGGKLWSTLGVVEVTRRWRAGPVALGPQVGVAAGRVQARGLGADRNLRVGRPWAEVRTGATLAVPFGATVGLTVRADLRVPLTLHRFVVLGDAAQRFVVWRTTRIGGAVALGIEVKFL